MKLLVIDRDRTNCEQIEAFVKDADITVACEPIRAKAVDAFRAGGFDAILIDPAPQGDLRPFIIGIRRTANSPFPPILVMAHDMTKEQVLAVGGNALLTKPLDKTDFLTKARNALRLVDAARMMSDEKTDFPSKDGIIAKSAFNQLFITCLDRADRYGENSYLIFVNVDNLAEIAEKDGAEAAAKVADNLRRTISRTRRLSDIAGHIEQARFCLLLLRVAKEDEPFLAANRFAEALKENHDLISTSATKAILKVWLLGIPSGEIPVEHVVAGNN